VREVPLCHARVLEVVVPSKGNVTKTPPLRNFKGTQGNSKFQKLTSGRDSCTPRFSFAATIGDFSKVERVP